MFSLAHCELTVFQSCVLFSISQEMELFDVILDVMLRQDAYSLSDVKLLVGFAEGIGKEVLREAGERVEKERVKGKGEEKVRWWKGI